MPGTRKPGDEPTCSIHTDTKLVCPRCVGAEGGTNTAKKHGSEKLSEWGKRGGRPRKKKD